MSHCCSVGGRSLSLATPTVPRCLRPLYISSLRVASRCFIFPKEGRPARMAWRTKERDIWLLLRSGPPRNPPLRPPVRRSISATPTATCSRRAKPAVGSRPRAQRSAIRGLPARQAHHTRLAEPRTSTQHELPHAREDLLAIRGAGAEGYGCGPRANKAITVCCSTPGSSTGLTRYSSQPAWRARRSSRPPA